MARLGEGHPPCPRPLAGDCCGDESAQHDQSHRYRHQQEVARDSATEGPELQCFDRRVQRGRRWGPTPGLSPDPGTGGGASVAATNGGSTAACPFPEQRTMLAERPSPDAMRSDMCALVTARPPVAPITGREGNGQAGRPADDGDLDRQPDDGFVAGNRSALCTRCGEGGGEGERDVRRPPARRCRRLSAIRNAAWLDDPGRRSWPLATSSLPGKQIRATQLVTCQRCLGWNAEPDTSKQNPLDRYMKAQVTTCGPCACRGGSRSWRAVTGRPHGPSACGDGLSRKRWLYCVSVWSPAYAGSQSFVRRAHLRCSGPPVPLSVRGGSLHP